MTDTELVARVLERHGKEIMAFHTDSERNARLLRLVQGQRAEAKRRFDRLALRGFTAETLPANWFDSCDAICAGVDARERDLARANNPAPAPVAITINFNFAGLFAGILRPLFSIPGYFLGGIVQGAADMRAASVPARNCEDWEMREAYGTKRQAPPTFQQNTVNTGGTNIVQQAGMIVNNF